MLHVQAQTCAGPQGAGSIQGAFEGGPQQHRRPSPTVAAEQTFDGRPSGADGYLRGSRVCMSAQHKVTANAPKAAAMIVAMMISIGIDVLSRPRGSRLGPAPIIFDDPPTLAQRNPFIGP